MVFLILAAQYEGWSLPLAVLTAVPFAGLGALLAIWLRGLDNDVYFQIGLVTLIGLAAKNAILIVEFASQRHQQGRSVYDAAMEAARLRFRPIVMTSLAFILAWLPLATSTAAASALRHPVGTVVVSGRDVGAHLAVELRRRSPVEGGELHDGRLADMDLVDVLRRHPGFDDQVVGLGHDQHQHLAGLDHAADRMNRALEDRAVLGCNEVDALELVLGRHPALAHLGPLRPDFAEILADLGAQVFVDLQDLKLD